MDKEAVLIIHGFGGSLNDNKSLELYLKEQGYDVFTFLLPGHEKKRITGVKEEDWLRTCEDNLNKIIEMKYNKIYLIGHSFGAIFSCYLAKKYNEYITKVVLISPSFDNFNIRSKNVKFRRRLLNSISMLISKEERGVTSGIFKISLESIKEFRKTVNNHIDDILSLNIPILFVLGTKDRMIPIDINRNVYNKLNNKYKELVEIEDGHHWLCNSSKKDMVCNKIYLFLIKESIDEHN